MGGNTLKFFSEITELFESKLGWNVRMAVCKMFVFFFISNHNQKSKMAATAGQSCFSIGPYWKMKEYLFYQKLKI